MLLIANKNPSRNKKTDSFTFLNYINLFNKFKIR